MNTQVAATFLGIVLQVGGAAYLLWQARVTSSKLAKYKTYNITWDNFALAVEDLAPECVNNFETPVAGGLVSSAAIPRVRAAWVLEG
jgi:hypothetical protein